MNKKAITIAVVAAGVAAGAYAISTVPRYPEQYDHVKYQYQGQIITLREARQLIIKHGYDVIVPELRTETGLIWRRGTEHEMAIADLK